MLFLLLSGIKVIISLYSLDNFQDLYIYIAKKESGYLIN